MYMETLLGRRGDTVWYVLFFFFKQKTAYEMRISDWSSDVCSSDLRALGNHPELDADPGRPRLAGTCLAQSPRRHGVAAGQIDRQIGRASCRERVCQYV